MTCIRTLILASACLFAVTVGAVSAPPAKVKGKGRKCPADKVVIGRHDIAKILAMLGAKCEVGTSDEQLLAYASHFDRSDPNHDGKQTRAEYVDGGSYMTPQARAGIFGATDNNADGVATRVEYVLNRCITDEAKAIVQATDADKNGKVTRAEFVAGSPIKDKALAGAVYDGLDTNSDGVITVPEYLRVWGGWARPNYKVQEKALGARLAKLGKSSGKPPAGGDPGVAALFKLADRDGDGKLSKAELRRLVAAGDTDGDELLSLKELTELQRKPAKAKPKRER